MLHYGIVTGTRFTLLLDVYDVWCLYKNIKTIDDLDQNLYKKITPFKVLL